MCEFLPAFSCRRVLKKDLKKVDIRSIERTFHLHCFLTCIEIASFLQSAASGRARCILLPFPRGCRESQRRFKTRNVSAANRVRISDVASVRSWPRLSMLEVVMRLRDKISGRPLGQCRRFYARTLIVVQLRVNTVRQTICACGTTNSTHIVTLRIGSLTGSTLPAAYSL